MNNPLNYALPLLLALTASNAVAREFFNIDFEDGIKPVSEVPVNVNSEWGFQPIFETVYGEGNHFIVTDSTSHSGSFSMRFTYEARNDFCNTCGTFEVIQKTDVDGVDFVVSDAGLDLTNTEDPTKTKENKGPAASPGKIVYNKSRGFSKWEILSIESTVPEDANNFTNDKLNLKLLSSSIDSTDEFIGGDEIAVARECGVDGNFTNDNIRRSDCDAVILWFGNVATDTQGPGESIFRRVYLKPEITGPKIHQKLHYLRPDRGGDYQDELRVFADSKGGPLIPQITNFKSMGGPGLIKPSTEFLVDLTDDNIDNADTPSPDFTNNFAVDFEFDRSIWYYLEEEYKASTLNATYDPASDPDSSTYDPILHPNPDPDDPNIYKFNPDGEFRLWLQKSQEIQDGTVDILTVAPSVIMVAIRLPPIVGGNGTHISFWGNIQHSLHSRGSWYIDDMRISDQRNFNLNHDGSIINELTDTGTNVSPPTPPSVTINAQ